MPLYNPPAAGGFALDANSNLLLPAATGVTTPAAGSVAQRVLTRAGQSQMVFSNLDTADLMISPSMETHSICKGEANGSSTFTFLNSGVQTNGVVSQSSIVSSTYSNSRDAVVCTTAATAGSAAHLLGALSTRSRGNALRRGGFYNVIRFNPVLLAGHQAAVGMHPFNTALGNDPSTAANDAFIGMICDAADTNWQIFMKPNGAAGTKIATTQAKITTGAMLALYTYAAPFGSTIFYQLENEETQTVIISGSNSLTLVTNIVQMNVLGVRVRNGATTTAAAIQMYNYMSVSRY